MLAYIVRRLLYSIPIVLGVSLVTFVLFNALVPPEIMAANALGGKNVSRAQIETWLTQNGYDLPRWPFFPARWRIIEASDGGKIRRGRIEWVFPAGTAPPPVVTYRVVPPVEATETTEGFSGTLEQDGQVQANLTGLVRQLPPHSAAGIPMTVTLALTLEPRGDGTVIVRERVPWFFPAPQRTQLWQIMASLLTFQFGHSLINRQNINEMIWQGMWPSFFLALPSFVLATAFSIAISLFVAYYRGTYLDLIGVVLCVVAMSVPVLVYIIAGQYLLGTVLRFFPIYGYSPDFFGWRFFFMPILISVVASLGGSVRFYRTILLEEVNQDYVRTARAKGLSERRIMLRHVLPNAMIPILTVLVIQIPYLFLGSLLLERFFGIPGLGARMLEAIVQIDYPVLRAFVFIGSILFVVGNLLTDISYTLVDPRVRLR